MLLLKEEELEKWFTPAEAATQNDGARVCEDCYHAYAEAAAVRARRREARERATRESEERQRQACLRLYDRFVDGKQFKNQQLAGELLEQQHREEQQRKRKLKATLRKRGEQLVQRQAAQAATEAAARTKQAELLGMLLLPTSVRAREAAAATAAPGGAGPDQDMDESSSVASRASLAPGDRVVDRVLGPGTIVAGDTEGREWFTVRFDEDGAVETHMDRARLTHADAARSRHRHAVQLSAAELVGGLGALPLDDAGPPLGSDRLLGDDELGEPGGDDGNDGAQGDETALDYFGLDFEAVQEREQEELRREPPDDPLCYDPDVDHTRAPGARHQRQHDGAGDAGAAVALKLPRIVQDPARAGVLCPFGCGVRLRSDNATLTGQVQTWAAHAKTCSARQQGAEPKVHDTPEESTARSSYRTRHGVGIAKVHGRVAELDF
jgi:hypothetical protein